jgi:hypothetical protein
MAGWRFKVGKRFQITIRDLAPVLDIASGDWVNARLVDGKIILEKA